MTFSEETQETSTTEVEATQAPVRTRAPALTATVDGISHKLLKYAFPTKAVPFTVTVNGVEAQAAVTAGRGASYTYLLINNTGFYLPKDVVVGAGAELEINFPDGFAFDETQAVRVSTYKPKAKRAVAAEGDDVVVSDGAEGTLFEQEVAEEQAAEAEHTEGRADDTPRAKRKSRK